MERQLSIKDWGTDWVVIIFDQPFFYISQEISYCLVRARWYGCPIGSEFCPVFVLTDNTGCVSTQTEWVSSDFQFVNWGELKLDAAYQAAAPDGNRGRE